MTVVSDFAKGPESDHMAFSHPTWSIRVALWRVECQQRGHGPDRSWHIRPIIIIFVFVFAFLLLLFVYYYFFKPSVKKYPKVEQKNKYIVVAGMNTNPGGVPT